MHVMSVALSYAFRTRRVLVTRQQDNWSASILLFLAEAILDKRCCPGLLAASGTGQVVLVRVHKEKWRD
eukprot:2083609-Rhodomonas_salina.1